MYCVFLFATHESCYIMSKKSTDKDSWRQDERKLYGETNGTKDRTKDCELENERQRERGTDLAMLPVEVALPVGGVEVAAARVEWHQHIEPGPDKSLRKRIFVPRGLCFYILEIFCEEIIFFQVYPLEQFYTYTCGIFYNTAFSKIYRRFWHFHFHG